MQGITEYQLIEKLKKLRTPGETEAFVDKYVIKGRTLAFHEYLRQYIADNALLVSDVMNKSCINKNYGYNIINGIRRRPGRDKVLALCIGAGMGFDDVQKALELAGQPVLNPRSERDVRIAVALNNGVNDVLKLNIQLEEKGVEPLQV